MQKINKASWPVLFVSDKLQLETDEGIWLRKIIENLTSEQGCSTVLSYAYGDAGDIVYSREDLGSIILDWNMQYFGRLHKKNNHLLENSKITSPTAAFIDHIRQRNMYIPILLMTDRGSVEDIPDDIYKKINGVIWLLNDTPQFIAGRIERSVNEYSKEVLPPFFKTLIKYVNEYKYAWHTPGHMGGAGFLKSPSGTAFHKFFGENVLRSDLSISVPELGSLLDHSGVTGEAENFSARVFGADQTYYVLNGTSTANQIIWRSQVSPGEEAIVDRNCHKSLNYAMIITNAKPKYMMPIRNGMGIIGPVKFDNIGKYKMSALTNSTYDGVCYDMRYVSQKLRNVLVNHFDEAWYAYAKFHPIYKNHFGMELPRSNNTVFCTQSTHKLLTAFSQASMIHVKLPVETKKSEAACEEFHNLFNESYMMHGSTSPQYSMIASLEVSTKMMSDNGQTANNDVIMEAIELRQEIARIKDDLNKKGDWFFDIWQPKAIESTDPTLLSKSQDYWKIKPSDDWHGFAVSDTYTMLDPIKLTFTCPGVDVNGNMDSSRGIPAAIVTNYLIDKGIVCEKTDYYSWLLLNSLGTTKGKQGTLVAELFKFKELYDNNILLNDVFPNLSSYYPKEMTLKQHCTEMHNYIIKKKLLKIMINASQLIPDQNRIPAEAYRCIVEKNVEFELLDNIHPEIEPRISAVMLVPYPPGIPIMMGGEVFNKKSQPILDYLKARQEFEFEFPGYESDIHGIERTEPDAQGKKHFKTLLIKKDK